MATLGTLLLSVGGLAVVISTVPFALTAIDYRQRDNGLAYLLLVVGLGIWNAMFVAQLLSARPIIQNFFLGLSVVGAVQAGLGWLLFASTASSTANVLHRRDVYGVVGVLGGLDIVLAVTAPVHSLYWQLVPTTDDPTSFATIDPGIGYWLHTGLLVLLFLAGTALFADSWLESSDDRYPRAYVVAGTASIVAIAGSNLFAPGGFGIGSLVAASLTSIGWLQASRGEPLAWLRGAK